METIARSAGFISPIVNRGFRKPFGELTNTPPHPVSERTPNKPASSTLTPKSTELTPTANLKLLMQVAAEKAEIEQQQQPSRRELFKEDHENDENKLVIDFEHDYSSGNQTPSSLTSTPSTTSSSSVNGKVSRKDKSLGLLCDKFILRFPRQVPPGEKCEIQLDDLAKQMNTERRRIYDIVNVLEAVQMMTKVGKNLYQWHGTTHQLMTLAWLRQLAVKLNLLQRYKDIKAMEGQESPGLGNRMMSPRDLKRSPLSVNSNNSPGSASLSSNCSPSPSPIERRTSLGVACQKFLMLFLVVQEPQAKINLDVAAKVIHGIGLADAIMKTRIRRLYDIANILQSLKLIQKIQITDAHGGKKPAFQYIGPTIDDIEVNRDVLKGLPSTRQRHSLLTFGKNLLDIPDDPGYCEIYSQKRNMPDTGFEGMQRFTKFPRTHSDEALNLVKRDVNKDNVENQIPRSHSLMDLGNACSFERSKVITPVSSSAADVFLRPLASCSPTTQRLMRLKPMRQSSQRALFKSPVDQRSSAILSPSMNQTPGVSLLKRALTSPGTYSSPSSDSGIHRRPIKLIQVVQPSGSNHGLSASTSQPQVMRVVGVEQPIRRPNTFVTVTKSPLSSASSAILTSPSNSPKDLRMSNIIRSTSF